MIDATAAALFWIPATLLAWVYLGYPLSAAVAGRLRPFEPRATERPPRRITVGIAAFDEAAQIAARVGNVLGQAVDAELEVIVASDGSVDETAAIVSAIAARDARVRLLDLPRAGQTATQNAIFAAATGDIVVLTDAGTRFEPGALAALVAPFSDPRVGCTTGRLHWIDGSRTATARSEGAYWRYEQLVRRLESRAGWLSAVTGAILAVRRSAYRAVPADASMDHLLPLYAREAGLVVLAVPEARAGDHGIAGLRDQLRNRSRTATRGIRANLAMAWRLAPWRHPAAALAIWSHKVLRWAMPWLILVASIGAAAAVASGSLLYAIPLVLGIAALAMAGAALVLRRSGIEVPRLLGICLAMVVVNVAFAIGWLNLLRGRRIEHWHRTEWVAEKRTPH